MTSFNNLSETSNQDILECFNDSFSDYAIPFQLNLEQLESKMHLDDVNKNISIGAFKDEKLVGFVLHGDRVIKNRRIAYNAGTGVRPSERGQKLTRRMYDFMVPTLKAKNINLVVLEVISDNIPAIKSYEAIGFEHVRQLICYKTELIPTNVKNQSIRVVESKHCDIDTWSKWGEVQPSWQNANDSIRNMGDDVKFLLAYHNDTLCGYCVVNTKNNRIIQMAVEESMRQQHVGTAILDYIESNFTGNVSMINVDSSDETIVKFLESKNFEETITQKEMLMNMM